MWRRALNMVADSVLAENFRKELQPLRESFGDDPDEIGAIFTGMLLEMFAESAGLFALELPPAEVPGALTQIRETLTGLDFEEQKKHVEEDERRYYESFARSAKPLLAAAGEAMESLLNCYVAGDYDTEADPNDLMVKALRMADEGGEEELKHAENLIARAGATALHGRPLWWRWDAEAYGPAARRLSVVLDLVQDYTDNGKSPLGSPQEFRDAMQTTRQVAREARGEIERQAAEGWNELVSEEAPKPSAPVPGPGTDIRAPSPVDELIEELIEQEGAPLTSEQVERCQADPETFIPALIELATDEYMQMEGSPGDGYAPIRAVQLLGKLKAAEAAPALIDIAAEVDPLAIIYSSAIKTLEDIGPPALEPLLDFMRYSRDTEAKTALAGALAAAGRDDERAYEAMLGLWEEAIWDEGKCLLAQPLAQLGGDRAIPLLQEALNDPDLPGLDYNEVVFALEELEVEVPERPAEPSPFDLRALPQSMLFSIRDLARVTEFAEDAPEGWQERPDGLAHAYATSRERSFARATALQVVRLPPDESATLIDSLLEAAQTIAFDAPTQDYPDWLRRVYDHLAECAGPEFQRRATGMLLSLQCYFRNAYDATDEPDHLLLAAAREPSSDHEAGRESFAQAGALILRGRSFWHRWPDETDPPLSDWLRGLMTLHGLLDRAGQIPLKSSEQVDPDAFVALLTGGEEQEPPPEIAELLDIVVEQKAGRLPLRQLRRFTHRRAAIVPHLISMVEDKRYWSTDGPGEGWAAILAVRLLAELKASQAADALVEAVADSQPDDYIQSTAVFGLMNIGRLARPAVQAYFRYGRDIKTKTVLAEVLGQIGRRGSEDFDFLQEAWEAANWEQNRRMVALAFGDLRDRRAIPLLQTALEDPTADSLDLEYVHWALRQLGVSPPPRPRRPSGLQTPAPPDPRLIYDEYNRPQRLKYNAWGEPLCPDCGKPLAEDEEGALVHP